MTAAVFELGGALAAALPDLAIGPWTRTPPGLVAFDAVAGPPESLWRVDLASDDAAGRAALTGGERSVARTHAVLDDVPRRLERALAELTRGSRPGPPRGDHLAAPAPELPRVEARLVAALARAEAQPPPQHAKPAPRPPGAPGTPSGAEPPARQPGRLERALQCAGDFAGGRARIETHLEGVLVARSITALSGDTELWIASRLSPAGAQLHARSVAVAVRTRHAWTRVLVLVVRYGGRLATLGMPHGPVAALSLVWSFLRDVLQEVRDLDARRQAAEPAAAPLIGARDFRGTWSRQDIRCADLLDVDMYFGPFTCIAGPNAAGKSNLFDAIRFLALLTQHPIPEAVKQLRETKGRLTLMVASKDGNFHPARSSSRPSSAHPARAAGVTSGAGFAPHSKKPL